MLLLFSFPASGIDSKPISSIAPAHAGSRTVVVTKGPRSFTWPLALIQNRSPVFCLRMLAPDPWWSHIGAPIIYPASGIDSKTDLQYCDCACWLQIRGGYKGAFSIYLWARTVVGRVSSCVCSESEELSRRFCSCVLTWIVVRTSFLLIFCSGRQTDIPNGMPAHEPKSCLFDLEGAYLLLGPASGLAQQEC